MFSRRPRLRSSEFTAGLVTNALRVQRRWRSLDERHREQLHNRLARPTAMLLALVVLVALASVLRDPPASAHVRQVAASEPRPAAPGDDAPPATTAEPLAE